METMKFKPKCVNYYTTKPQICIPLYIYSVKYIRHNLSSQNQCSIWYLL